MDMSNQPEAAYQREAAEGVRLNRSSPRLIFGLAPVVWAAGCALLPGAGWYLIRIMAARTLNIHAFGVFSELVAFQIILSALIDAGMTYGFSRLIPSLRRTGNREKLRSILVAGGIIQLGLAGCTAVVQILLQRPITSGLFGADVAPSSIPLLASLLWLLSLVPFIFLEAVASSFERYDLRLLLLGSRVGWMGISCLVLLVLPASVGESVLRQLFLLSALPLLPILAAALYYLPRLVSHLALAGRATVELLRTASGTALLSFAGVAFPNLDLLIIGRYVGQADTGRYAAVISCLQIGWTVVAAIMQVYLPKFSADNGQSNKPPATQEEMLISFHKYAALERKMLFAGFASVFVFGMCSEQILGILFGPSFNQAGKLLQLIAPGVPFFAAAQLRLQALLAKGASRSMAKRAFIALIAYTTAVSIGTLYGGASGAALGNSIGYAAIYVIYSASSFRAFAQALGKGAVIALISAVASASGVAMSQIFH